MKKELIEELFLKFEKAYSLRILNLKAKDFATELTSHNVVEKDLNGDSQITNEHIENNLAVRKILAERGIKPESLPALENIKKVQRKLEETKRRF
ncbi:hypothetical protein [Chryseobacterium shandongense]|uniref:hypothetical protein n=1 Tax=Chryseobacterium shandongense TaxID=1493872 RepID=UPI001E3869F4|nr:hypothetical protein [Chryseobacterium shandongense]